MLPLSYDQGESAAARATVKTTTEDFFSHLPEGDGDDWILEPCSQSHLQVLLAFLFLRFNLSSRLLRRQLRVKILKL